MTIIISRYIKLNKILCNTLIKIELGVSNYLRLKLSRRESLCTLRHNGINEYLGLTSTHRKLINHEP